MIQSPWKDGKNVRWRNGGSLSESSDREPGPREEQCQLALDLDRASLGTSPSGHENEMDSPVREPGTHVTVGFPQQPLGPVSLDRLPGFSAGDDTDLPRCGGIFQEKKDEAGTVMNRTLIEYSPVVVSPLNPFRGGKPTVRGILPRGRRLPGGHYTASRALPLARRRLSTWRPAWVFMRERKPCFFFLRRLCG